MMVDSLAHLNPNAQTLDRMDSFELLYGRASLDLACHAAFPLTLTTDLVYCLRENFVPQSPWYSAADVLLSSFCTSVGHDLYEMSADSRKGLLQCLIQRYSGQQIERLESFMQAYLSHRLTLDPPSRAHRLASEYQWTALACLRPHAARAAILQKLQSLYEGEDRFERLRLASMVYRFDDLLSQAGFEPFELKDWAKRFAKGDPINAWAETVQALKKSGFPLKRYSFRVATVTQAVPELETLTESTITTVLVDSRGDVIDRPEHTVYSYREALGSSELSLEMMAIPGGIFQMGSPESEAQRYRYEGPQHAVSVPPFWMSKYAITQSQWGFVAALEAINQDLAPDPSYFKGRHRPVENITWESAVEYCARLSLFTGREYSLPSEAQWEYACRGGTTTPFHFGATLTSEQANYRATSTYDRGPKGEYRAQTTDVGQFPPNAFGLHDMHGNVWEWCADPWHANYDGAPTDGSIWQGDSDRHALRGGSWFDLPWYCRSACRFVDRISVNYRGFRVVCRAPRTQ